jgi:hypothetical protein
MLQEVASLLYNALKFELWGFDSGAAEDSRLRGCYAVSIGKHLSRFRKAQSRSLCHWMWPDQARECTRVYHWTSANNITRIQTLLTRNKCREGSRGHLLRCYESVGKSSQQKINRIVSLHSTCAATLQLLFVLPYVQILAFNWIRRW